MTNIQIKTLGPEISIPTDLAGFKTKPSVVWTSSSWRDKIAFKTTHGYINEFKNDNSIAPGSGSGNLYSPQETDGIDFTVNSGTLHHGNTETVGACRWMPASVFNGCGFEVHQSDDHENAIYLRQWAVIFSNRLNEGYRFWGVDCSLNFLPRKGYRYLTFPQSEIDSIRKWGSQYVLQGFIFNYRTNSWPGSSRTSSLKIYNVKVGHKFSDINNNYRYLPPSKRSYANRNNVNAGFTDPFS